MILTKKNFCGTLTAKDARSALGTQHGLGNQEKGYPFLFTMLESRPESKPTTVRQALHATVAVLYELTTPLSAEEPLRAALRREALEAVRYAEHAALEPKDIVFFAASLGTLIAYCQLAALEYNPEFAGVAATFSQIRDSLSAKAVASQEGGKTAGAPALPRIARKAKRSSQGVLHRERSKTHKTSARQKAILAIVQERPTVRLDEITEHFPGISSRTLRRDLEALATSGFVAREGTTSNVSYRVDSDKVRTFLK